MMVLTRLHFYNGGMSSPYPIFLQLEYAPVLIVGGGSVALRKTRGLLDSGAVATIISPQFDPAFTQLANVTLRTQRYDSAVLREQSWRLVFAATNDTHVNQQVYQDARGCNLLCCRCDDGSAGDFVGGAVRGDDHARLVVSTSGVSPVLAARIADQAWQSVDPFLIQWAELLESWRPKVISALSGNARAALLRRISGPEMENILRKDGIPSAQNIFTIWLNEQQS